MPRTARIRQTRDIRRLLGRGTRRKTSHLDVFFALSPSSSSRFGLVVPKHRHNGVQRNLLKRRLRDIGRRELLPRFREAGLVMDILVRARREAYGANFETLRDELVEIVEALCSSRSS